MRFARGDVRDHNVLHLNDHRPSYRPQRTLQQSRRPNIRFREILGASQFSTFFESFPPRAVVPSFCEKSSSKPSLPNICFARSSQHRGEPILVPGSGTIQLPPAAGKDETAEYDRSPWFRKCPDNKEGKHVRANVPDAE